jgi:hypothetical protein
MKHARKLEKCVTKTETTNKITYFFHVKNLL